MVLMSRGIGASLQARASIGVGTAESKGRRVSQGFRVAGTAGPPQQWAAGTEGVEPGWSWVESEARGPGDDADGNRCLRMRSVLDGRRKVRKASSQGEEARVG